MLPFPVPCRYDGIIAKPDATAMTPTDTVNAFGRWSRPATAILLLVIWFVMLALFRAFPGLDLATAGAAFDPAACAATTLESGCAGFPAATDPALSLIREALHPTPVIIAAGVLVLALAVLARGGGIWSAAQRRRFVLVGVMLAGPLALVNGILKEYWGRPRPVSTDLFGGTLPFVEAGRITDFCASNCSFISGEAAAAGWLACLAAVMALAGWRRTALALVAVSLVMAGLRVAFGAHYLSDAVLGYLSSLVLFSMLALLSDSLARRRSAT